MNKVASKILIIILLFALIFTIGKRTYSSLYSLINGNTDIDLADFSVKLNGNDITSSYDLTISDITFVNDHALSSVVAPGSTGQFVLSLDTSGTDVSVLYTLTFDDRTTNENKLLIITSVYINDTLIELTDNTYSEIIPLSEINDLKNIVVNVEWVSDDDYDNEDLSSSEMLSVDVNVKQYNG